MAGTPYGVLAIFIRGRGAMKKLLAGLIAWLVGVPCRKREKLEEKPKIKREPQNIVITAKSEVQARAANKLGSHYNITPSATVKPDGGQ